ncbi:hypothetical protein N9295_01010, partial [bacterium]|nr:hypothetical protein [bacterium]
MADNPLTILQHLRDISGAQETVGLGDEIIARFCATDTQLVQAINEAGEAHHALVKEFGMDVMALPESELIPHLQQDYVNFYARAKVFARSVLASPGKSSRSMLPLDRIPTVTRRRFSFLPIITLLTSFIKALEMSATVR